VGTRGYEITCRRVEQRPHGYHYLVHLNIIFTFLNWCWH
jgi:hypothetical protein